jgi:filamentous hemagglutinin
MTDATSQTKDLSRGRKAWWNPEKGVVVITNPKSIDVGTAFRPRNGKEYFENLR